ncbi:MAG: STAS domain-containing protein [Arenicellales bacterium]
MEHSTERDGGATVVRLTGDVDLQHSPEARKVLLAAAKGGRPVVVDLSGVSYIDSSGIASLVEGLQEARKSGGSLALAAVSEGAMRVLHLARLDKVFVIADDVSAAIAKLG